MKKSRFTEAKIMEILKQAEGGVPVPELCREHGMSPFRHLLRNCLPGNECQLLQMAGEVWRYGRISHLAHESPSRRCKHRLPGSGWMMRTNG